MLKRAARALVATAAPIPHWLVVAGGAFLSGFTESLTHDDLGPLVQGAMAGDWKGAGGIALRFLAAAAVGGAVALVGVAKKTLPGWLQGAVDGGGGQGGSGGAAGAGPGDLPPQV